MDKVLQNMAGLTRDELLEIMVPKMNLNPIYETRNPSGLLEGPGSTEEYES